MYVDEPVHPFGRMVMCHMLADTPAELHAMADRIGVARKWYQSPQKASTPHYDIAKSKRVTARVKLGRGYYLGIDLPRSCPRGLWKEIYRRARIGLRESEKAWADMAVWGSGYVRLTSDGVQHVPFTSVRLAPGERHA